LTERRIRRRRIGLYAASLAGALLWLSAIAAAPLLRSRGSSLSPFLYACFSPLCHQRPERSFFLFGYPLAVCARCTGIYLGSFIGLLAYPLSRGFDAVRLPRTRTLALISSPLALDWAANLLGLWNTGSPLRFVSGWIWGLILPFYFMTGVGELVGRDPRS
jgi:uncharacterized membrane protein